MVLYFAIALTILISAIAFAAVSVWAFFVVIPVAIILIGYVLLPTAPPRMLPEFGFSDTLASLGAPNHGSSFIQLASNPYAAMPSLHSADALIVGIALAFFVKSWIMKAIWLAWPVWVWISVMATGNHFWLDIAAGILVAGVAAPIVYRDEVRRFFARRRAAAAAT